MFCALKTILSFFLLTFIHLPIQVYGISTKPALGRNLYYRDFVLRGSKEGLKEARGNANLVAK